MRFYQPESGEVNFNDSCNSCKVPLEWWRRSVGLIPQDIHIFNGTVLENIIPDADDTKVRTLTQITEDYGLDPFVKSLPLGFSTLIGEDNVKLSGGPETRLLPS
jgi:ATP-binding cassette subfamily B protein